MADDPVIRYQPPSSGPASSSTELMRILASLPHLNLADPFVGALDRQADHFQVFRAAGPNEIRARDHRLRVQGAHDLIVYLRPTHDVKRGVELTVTVRKRDGTDQNED